jgi:hypothetical protein
LTASPRRDINHAVSEPEGEEGKAAPVEGNLGRAKWASNKLYADALQARLADKLAEIEGGKPAQGGGSFAQATRAFRGEAAARDGFARAVGRLLEVDGWGPRTGVEGAVVSLHGEDGERLPAGQPVAVGRFARLLLHGEKAGPDWMRVESLDRTDERVALALKPAADPSARPPAPGVTRHHLGRDAVHAFRVERKGATVTATMRGTDERPNSGREAGGFLAAARNTRIAKAVASDAWRAFVESLIAD